MPRLWLSVRSPALPTGHRREHTRPGYRASCFAVPQPPQRRATPFTDGRFDAFASCLLERLRVRDGGVVGALSAMKSTMTCRLQEYLVHLSKLGEVFRTESPRNNRVSNHLGLQHADFHTNRRRLPIVQLPSEPFEAYAHARRIRRSISSRRSAFSWMMPPRCKNWAVCLYLWPAASITSDGAVDV